MYVVEPRAQHSAAAQYPLHKAANQARADQITYQRSMYVHACCVPFVSWGMELLAFASRLLAPKMLDHLLYYYICLSF